MCRYFFLMYLALTDQYLESLICVFQRRMCTCPRFQGAMSWTFQ